jgi:hypothetical protein
MLRKLKFLHLFSQSRFAEALAALGNQPWPRSGREQWAAYRQGLFATVSATKWDGRSMYGGMAVAVSLAICGHHAESERLVKKLDVRWNARFFRARLVRSLAPYARGSALALLRRSDAYLGHKIVLLEQSGESHQASSLLQTALDAGRAEREPQLRLLASNLIESSPIGKLACLNAFLASHGLASLKLKDATKHPVIGNVEAESGLSRIDGPLVSILMTAYNIGDRISVALEGLLNQTWHNLEIIVVDDASSDDTGSVVKAFAAKDSRVRYFRLPNNAGTYVAKTYGFEKARGEFVTCHDSDDWSHPQRVERQALPLVENPDLVATTSQWVRMEDSGRYHVRLVYPLMHLNPASAMFRREQVAEQAGLWDAARIGADSEFNARLHLVFGSKAIRRIAQPLTLGAYRENSLMTAADTGYNAEGLSPSRLAYWEAWARWHIRTLSQGNKPFMPPITEPCRPFEAPDTVRVPPDRVLAAMGPVQELLCP